MKTFDTDLLDATIATRDALVAKYENLTYQLDTVTAQPDLVDNVRVELNNIHTAIGKVLAEAEALNKTINEQDLDVKPISFVCSNCGAYACDRKNNGTCNCDNGCGRIGFDMIVI